MAEKTPPKPISRLVTAADLDGRDQEIALVAQNIALSLIDMGEKHGKALMATACITAASCLILGRTLHPGDTDILAAAELFAQTVLAHRDVLRENATNTQTMPKGVM